MGTERQAETTKDTTENIYKVQCFPMYPILLAIGRTHVDYLSLDVEGLEYKILRTIPWHKVYMQVGNIVSWNEVKYVANHNVCFFKLI
jgi:hypothetical protein